MPSDEERADNLQAIAAAIFARHGIDFAAVQRAGGWTNAVWLADGLVLRLATGKEQAAHDSPLLREARLAALFGPAVGYPALVDAGTTGGYAWTLAARIPGRSLGEAWAGLALPKSGSLPCTVCGRGHRLFMPFPQPRRLPLWGGEPGSTTPTPARPRQVFTGWQSRGSSLRRRAVSCRMRLAASGVLCPTRPACSVTAI